MGDSVDPFQPKPGDCYTYEPFFLPSGCLELPVTLWQIAASLKWNRPWDDFALPLRRAAVNETAAHLRYLTRRNRAVRLRGVRPFTFARPEGAVPVDNTD